MIIYRSWKAPTAPFGPHTCSARACHDDPPGRPHDLGHRPLSQRSFLWPERLTAGGAAAKEASSGAVGPGEALGTLVTISGYVKRPRYARLNTPMGADGAISCMSCASPGSQLTQDGAALGILVAKSTREPRGDQKHAMNKRQKLAVEVPPRRAVEVRKLATVRALLQLSGPADTAMACVISAAVPAPAESQSNTGRNHAIIRPTVAQ